jgi:hypothetical protein
MRRLSFLLALVFACAPGARSQSPATPAKAAAIPRTADGKPDFSGIYQWPTYLPGDERGHSNATTFDRKYFAPLKPGGEAFLEPRTGDPHHDEPRDFCMPAGFPGGILSGNAMQFFQTKNYLVMVHEFQRMTRIIPLDGRPHRKGLEPMFDGDPVGHWEGDTLVVDTTNQNTKTWFDTSGNFKTEALHVTEKFIPQDANTIVYEATITDPTIYTQPWTARWNIGRNRQDKMSDGHPYEQMEFGCIEGNIDLQHYTEDKGGKAPKKR